MLRWIILCAISCGLFFLLHTAESCNEAVCASVVSKCMLTQSCKCDLKNCSCCKECYNCLSYLYSECCSCVDMCPKPTNVGSALSKQSHVEEFTDSVPGLFLALTVEDDVQQRWTTFTFPVDLDVNSFSPKPEKEIKYILQSAEQEVNPAKPNILTVNCTVAYMAECMSWNKCKTYCQSMGSASYRWFHDGCCECIGHKCIKYGINESSCMSHGRIHRSGNSYCSLLQKWFPYSRQKSICKCAETDCRFECRKCSDTKGEVRKDEDYTSLDEDMLDYGDEMD